MSEKDKIYEYIHNLESKNILDIGCGFDKVRGEGELISILLSDDQSKDNKLTCLDKSICENTKK